jgi:iron(III) transport system permease protein
MPLLIVAVFLLAIESRALPALNPGRPNKVGMRLSLGPWTPMVAAGVAVWALFTVVVPIGYLFVQAGDLGQAFGVAGDSLVRSLGYAAISATIMTVVGFPLGYLIHNRVFKSWRLLDLLAVFTFALPGMVLGVGMITLWNHRWTNFVYGTPVILVLAWSVKFMALSVRILAAQLAMIPASMEEAALVAGASWSRTFLVILAPLSRYGLAAAWLAGYIFSLRDSGVAMLVYPPGLDTLPVRTFTTMANGSPSTVAALCALMVIAAVVPGGLLWAAWTGLTRRRYQ